MFARDRVFAAIERTGPDRPPLYVSWPTDGVLCEQGARLPELLRRYPNDVTNFRAWKSRRARRGPLPMTTTRPRWTSGGWSGSIASSGWPGIPNAGPSMTGMRSQPIGRRPRPYPTGPEFEAQRAATQEHQQRYYALGGWINLFEILHAMRRFEDVLMDLAEDAQELHRLADMVVQYQEATVRYLLAQGVDGVMFADDWGTGIGPIVLARMLAAVLQAPLRAAHGASAGRGQARLVSLLRVHGMAVGGPRGPGDTRLLAATHLQRQRAPAEWARRPRGGVARAPRPCRLDDARHAGAGARGSTPDGGYVGAQEAG